MDFRKLQTVKQIAEANPAFSEAGLRWLVFHAERNGLDRALVRVGRKLLVDVDRFGDWLEARAEKSNAA